MRQEKDSERMNPPMIPQKELRMAKQVGARWPKPRVHLIEAENDKAFRPESDNKTFWVAICKLNESRKRSNEVTNFQT